MKFVFDKKVLEYQGTLGFPERMNYVYDFLKDRVEFSKPTLYINEPIVHEKELIQSVKDESFHNSDSPAYENIFDIAMFAVNSAITAQKVQGFSIVEPPGHHAYKNSLGGFCYFNNIAEAVKRSKLKTLIIDIDGHHGNGTQDIFENDEQVFFISLHKSPCYPGTGLSSHNNILNYPLPANCGEEIYLETLDRAIKIALEKFQPKQIAVSAGFDTYKKDPLASLGLEKNSYFKIGKLIRKTANKTNSRIFVCLEGGYTTELGELIFEFSKGLDS